MHFFVVHPDTWLADTFDLTAEQTGAFWNLCAFYMLKDGRVPDDDHLLARVTKLSVRRWRTTKKLLIDGGYIDVRDGWLWQERCEKRLEKDGKFAKSQAEKARKKWPKKTANSLENNDTEGCPGIIRGRCLPEPEPEPLKKGSIRIGNSPSVAQPENHAFAGAIIRLDELTLRRWKEAFGNINVEAQLASRDAWLAGRPASERAKWFVSTANWLAKKDAEATATPAAPKTEAELYWAERARGTIF